MFFPSLKRLFIDSILPSNSNVYIYIYILYIFFLWWTRKISAIYDEFMQILLNIDFCLRFRAFSLSVSIRLFVSCFVISNGISFRGWNMKCKCGIEVLGKAFCEFAMRFCLGWWGKCHVRFLFYSIFVIVVFCY